MAGTFMIKEVVGQTAQFVVDQGQQLLLRLLIAVAPFEEQLVYIVRSRTAS
ncbi:MAG: hypothetical protein WKF84_23850 [Pyrinomonadaceae bacterium]